MMIDTHAHLSIEDYSNIDEIVKKMGNNIIIVSGSNTKNNKEVLSLIEKYNNVYGTLGIHPEEVDNVTDVDLNFIEENINNPKIIGIGEIGLDFYLTKSRALTTNRYILTLSQVIPYITKHMILELLASINK
jgi:TatD DNase family protein